MLNNNKVQEILNDIILNISMCCPSKVITENMRYNIINWINKHSNIINNEEFIVEVNTDENDETKICIELIILKDELII